MKRIIYLSLLFLIPALYVKANNVHGLDGVYTNTVTFDQIRIDAYRKGIRVKGLHGTNIHHWYRFRRVSPNTFADNRGNRIKIESRHRGIDRLIFKSRRGHVDVYRRGVIHHNPYNSCEPFDNGWSSYDRDWYGSYDDNNRNDRRRYQNDNDRYTDRNRDRGFSSFSAIEGTYQSDNNRLIAIVSTRDGFKAKFSGERTWKNYVRNGDAFFDSDGNSYMRSNDNVIIWKGKYSGNTIRLEKIDDEVRF